MASLNELTQALGYNKAAHLLRRCTFGPDISQIKSFESLTPAQAVDQLFTDQDKPSAPIDTATSESWVNPPIINKAGGTNSDQNDLIDFFKAWHVDVMRNSGDKIKEKITWFYHTHIPVSRDVVESSESLYYQNCLFRYYALGSFKEMFKKICIDNAMLRYIDGYSNHKDSPNENFAREMLELYSIGKGPQIANGNYTNYTEDDIKAATRILTGWIVDDDYENLDTDTGIPIGKMSQKDSKNPDIATGHDSGSKTFSEVFDNKTISTSVEEMINNQPTTDGAAMELDEMIEMIFEKIETAKYIVRKLYRFFIYHIITDEIETDIINPLAQVLFDNDYIIAEPLKVLFKSEHFFDTDSIVTDDISGALIKSPMDITLGVMRFFNVSFPDRETETEHFYTDMNYLVERIHEQGLDFYEPYDVAGYDAYHQIPGYNRNWITSYGLAHRYQIGDYLMRRLGNPEDFTFHLDIVDWVENSGHITDPKDASGIVTTLVENLFAVTINTERFNYFLNSAFLDGFMPSTWSGEWSDYQTSKDDSTVRAMLEALLSALIQTPEFQLC